jgi:hypothetical protein
MSRGPTIDYVERSSNYPKLTRLVDPVARGRLLNENPALSRANATGGNTTLGHFELRDVSAAGRRGAVDFGSISGWPVPRYGNSRAITATAIWRATGQRAAGFSKLFQAYRMSVVDLQSGKWYVNEISAATEAVGAK